VNSSSDEVYWMLISTW